MTPAWIAIAVIGLGLPLGAWWVGGRPLWARSDQRAITRGGVLEDGRLRAATVEEARTQLAVWGARGDVAQRVRLALAALWVGLGVLLVVASVVSGDWSWHFLLLAVNVTAVVVPQILLRRNLRRAIDLNSETSAP
ncbi:MAG: hypothetical protein JWP46_1361 [Modestobacter sp.]|nr:hypothetical protein [Modestobacter sp.]MDQ1660090.1 hypothetical protein [Blastococcus sp.]